MVQSSLDQDSISLTCSICTFSFQFERVSMSSEIAVRKYSLVENGRRAEVTVRLFRPEPDPDESTYRCRFVVEWPSETQDLYACGVDAIQALLLAVQMLGATIYTSQAVKEGKLVWLEPGCGFGLPVSRNIEDILQGDDRRI